MRISTFVLIILIAFVCCITKNGEGFRNPEGLPLNERMIIDPYGPDEPVQKLLDVPPQNPFQDTIQQITEAADLNSLGLKEENRRIGREDHDGGLNGFKSAPLKTFRSDSEFYAFRRLATAHLFPDGAVSMNPNLNCGEYVRKKMIDNLPEKDFRFQDFRYNPYKNWEYYRNRTDLSIPRITTTYLVGPKKKSSDFQYKYVSMPQ